jgi:hypothetical protein
LRPLSVARLGNVFRASKTNVERPRGGAANGLTRCIDIGGRLEVFDVVVRAPDLGSGAPPCSSAINVIGSGTARDTFTLVEVVRGTLHVEGRGNEQSGCFTGICEPDIDRSLVTSCRGGRDGQNREEDNKDRPTFLVIDILKNHSVCAKKPDCQLLAITVFNESTVTDAELAQWNQLGVRGIRINIESSATGVNYDTSRHSINSTANRVTAYPDWRCPLYISGQDWNSNCNFHLHIEPKTDISLDNYNTVSNLPIAVIADHRGAMKGTTALPANVTPVTERPGYKSRLALAKAGKVYIKISAFFRFSKLTSGGYDDLERLIKKFADEVPGRLVWASDWPHTSGQNRT